MCVERIVFPCETETPIVRCKHRRYSIRSVIHGCFWDTLTSGFVDWSFRVWFFQASFLRERRLSADLSFARVVFKACF